MACTLPPETSRSAEGLTLCRSVTCGSGGGSPRGSVGGAGGRRLCWTCLRAQLSQPCLRRACWLEPCRHMPAGRPGPRPRPRSPATWPAAPCRRAPAPAPPRCPRSCPAAPPGPGSWPPPGRPPAAGAGRGAWAKGWGQGREGSLGLRRLSGSMRRLRRAPAAGCSIGWGRRRRLLASAQAREGCRCCASAPPRPQPPNHTP
jgi:hypothetical protein